MSTDNPGATAAAVPVCGIGASAGGIEALTEFFGALPTDLGLAYVVVVHLAPDHKSELPAILARRTRMPVVQQADAQPVHVGLEPLDQSADGVGVSPQTASHQRGILC